MPLYFNSIPRLLENSPYVNFLNFAVINPRYNLENDRYEIWIKEKKNSVDFFSFGTVNQEPFAVKGSTDDKSGIQGFIQHEFYDLGRIPRHEIFQPFTEPYRLMTYGLRTFTRAFDSKDYGRGAINKLEREVGNANL